MGADAEPSGGRMQPGSPVETEILLHYADGAEKDRLRIEPRGRLEFLRTMELLHRFLPGPPARLLDVGGGPGHYAVVLEQAGYDVVLVDPLELHLEQARAAGVAQVRLGDARHLHEEDASVDAVLLLGPLYHLTERADRILAWSEAVRVVRPGGVVAGAAISRFASLIDGLSGRHLLDPAFREIVDADLRTGQHRNPQRHDRWFTTGYFHHPDELADEMTESGLAVELVAAIEGPGQLMRDSVGEWLDDPDRRGILLEHIARVESEPSMLGSTGHLFAVGRRRE